VGEKLLRGGEKKDVSLYRTGGVWSVGNKCQSYHRVRVVSASEEALRGEVLGKERGTALSISACRIEEIKKLR